MHTHAHTHAHTYIYIHMMSSLRAFTSHARLCSSRTDHAHPAPPSCSLMLALIPTYAFFKNKNPPAAPHRSSALPACSAHIDITALVCFSALPWLHTLVRSAALASPAGCSGPFSAAPHLHGRPPLSLSLSRAPRCPRGLGERYPGLNPAHQILHYKWSPPQTLRPPPSALPALP